MNHICKLCGQPMIEGQQLNPAEGPYPPGTPNIARDQVHAECFVRSIQDVIDDIADTPAPEAGIYTRPPESRPYSDIVDSIIRHLRGEFYEEGLPTLEELQREMYLRNEERRQRPELN